MLMPKLLKVVAGSFQKSEETFKSFEKNQLSKRKLSKSPSKSLESYDNLGESDLNSVSV